MSGVVNYLISLPFSLRVAIGVFLFVFVVWKLGRKIILRILSIIPFLVKRIFLGIYLLIDTILSVLHKRIGWIFVTADEQFGEVCEKVDCKIERWYTKWRGAERAKIKECFLIYIISCLIIIIPSYIETDNRIIKVGENVYLKCETFILKNIRESRWYDSQKELSEGKDWLQKAGINGVYEGEFQTTLVVTGLKSTLLVRDIPNKEMSVTLDKLCNGDCVIWRGETAFSYVDNKVEMWAKITLENGIIGWSRMDYLYPLDYENRIYYVTESKEMGDE